MSSTSNASFSCCFWGIAETARETLLDIKILYIINIYYFLLLVNLRIKKEPVAICDQVPLASLWDTFHFLYHQLLCVTSEKNARLLLYKIYIPILSENVKMNFFKFFCSVKPVKWGLLVLFNVVNFLLPASDCLLKSYLYPVQI